MPENILPADASTPRDDAASSPAADKGSAVSERVLRFNDRLLDDFCGRNGERLRQIEAEMGARVVARGGMLKIFGPTAAVEKTANLIEGLVEVFQKGGRTLAPPQMRYAIQNARGMGEGGDIRSLAGEGIDVSRKSKRINPMTPGQARYIQAIHDNDIVFGLGPAGTGKTYLAMAMAVHSLMSGRTRRIVLARPAVEAGEKLGFLPGDISEKLDPYVRPLYDALYDMMEPERVMGYLESGVIEIAPLAFMRGRTLNDSFILLDEAQNSSVEQMKMFLTRLGFDSKAVITGDTSQIDLERGRLSGLIHAERVLQQVDGIAFVRFEQRDIVRHALVQRIVEAYDKAPPEAAQLDVFGGTSFSPGGPDRPDDDDRRHPAGRRPRRD